MNKKQKTTLFRIICSAALLILLRFIPVTGIIRFFLYMIPYLLIGYDVLRKAFKGIKNRQPMDESLLMCVATMGAIILGVYEDGTGGRGDYVKAVAVMLLPSLSFPAFLLPLSP